MEDTRQGSMIGRVLVEPVEYVDMREIASGKHGSHRSSPEIIHREAHPKNFDQSHQTVTTSHDHSYNCVQIALQSQAEGNHAFYDVNTDESSQIGEQMCTESVAKTPSKDEVLSVVIQKLTELVRNSEQQQRENSDQVHVCDGNGGKVQVKESGSGKTRLCQCPKCPCLFAVKRPVKKGQLCSCCEKASKAGDLTSRTSDEVTESCEVNCAKTRLGNREIVCEICSITVNSYNDLLYHLATHKTNIFRCNLCDFVTTLHAAIEKHQDVHKAELAKKCVCNICGHETDDFQKLEIHIKTVHQSIKEVLLKCSVCGFSTKYEDTLKTHMWTHVAPERNPQSSEQLDDGSRKQKSSFSKRSQVVNTTPLDSSKPNQNEQKSDSQTSDSQDSNTKLFKCLLCGYLCEKLCTLKSHAWRHAGQEGCSYPVMHMVEDVKAITGLVENEDTEKENSGDVAVATQCCARGCSSSADGVCRCQPLLLPREEHEIVQKVFADATSSEPEAVDSSSSSPDVANTCSGDMKPSAAAVSVIKKASGQTVNTEKILNEQGEICDSFNEPNMCWEKVDNSVEIVTVDSNLNNLAGSRDMLELDETPVNATVSENQIAESVIEKNTRVPETGQISENSETVQDASLCVVKGNATSKRKATGSETEQVTKKVCSEPGISKMLLNVVENAIQTREETLRGEDRTCGQNEDSSSAKKASVVKVITAPPTSSTEDHYQCPICKQIFPSSVQTHVCNQHSKPVFKCHKCPAVFWHVSRLQAHMGTHDAILKCSKCSFSCGSEIALRDHMKKTHLPAKSTQCPSCHKEIVEKSPKAHEETCVLHCWYGCRECDFVAHSVDELQLHGRESHRKPYRCSLCDYASATPNGIKNHMKFHNTDKPYKCHLCDFSGAYPQSLRSHMKRHSQHVVSSGPSLDHYKCKFCSYTSGHLPSMKSHMWRHASDPGYDYDGQDIIKMVIKITDASKKREENVPEERRTFLTGPAKDDKTDTVTRSPTQSASSKVPQELHRDVESRQPESNHIQYGSVIFQCSQCGFKSNDHNYLVEHLRGHLEESEKECNKE